MTKKYISIIGISIIILYLVIAIFPFNLKEVNQRAELLQKYQNVEKSIRKSAGHYVIKNSKLVGTKNINVDLTGVSEGELFNTGHDVYGYIVYKNKCIQKDYVGSKITVSNNKCNEVDKPLVAFDKIQKESKNEELIKDTIDSENEYKYSSKYYFVGENPNNYIVFSNKCWRIVNIAKNNSLKLVYEGEISKNNDCEGISTDISGNIGLYTWDYRRDEDGTWNEKSSLQETMYYWQKDGTVDNKIFQLNLDDEHILEAEWYVGEVSESTTNLSSILDEERKITSNLKVGLLNSSDYLKVSCSDKNEIRNECKEKNYLFKEKYHWWTINSVKDEFKSVWIVTQDGELNNIPVLLSHEYYFSGVRLAIYLNENTKLIGNGSELNPYRVVSA